RAPSRVEMEANAASDEGVHFQSYPFDFLEFLNHQRFEPMEAYNHEHAKAVAALPCPQPQYEYAQPPTAAPPAHFDRVPATIGTPKPKAEGPSSSSSSATSSGTVQVKKAEPGAPAPPPPPQQQQQQPPYSTPAVVQTAGQPLFDSTAAAAAAAAAYNTPQWGIVDLSGHQHLFSSLKRGQAPPPTAATVTPDSQAGKDDKNYFRRLKYFIDRRFPCGVCQKSFKQSSHLVQHMLVHTGERPYECTTCGRTYNHISSLIRHRRCHKDTEDATVAANAAAANVAAVNVVAAATAAATAAASITAAPGAEGAAQPPTQSGNPQSHQATHAPPGTLPPRPEYKCDICGKGYVAPQNLLRHRQLQHEGVQLSKDGTSTLPYLPPGAYLLPQDPQGTGSEGDTKPTSYGLLGAHPLLGLIYGCSDCGERFPDLFHVMSHKEVHVAEKPYPCDVCGKCFGFIENLMWHKLVHQAAPERLIPPDETAAAVAPLENGLASGENMSSYEDHPTLPSGERFSCSICGQTFKHFLGLVTHKYVHLVRRTLACSVCGQSFAGAYDLLLHRRTHLQKRHFSCPVCGKRFWEAALLMRHQRCHTEERPYRCAVCGRGFLRSWYLRQHKVVHTGERAYKCALCNKRFAQSSSLAEHQRLHVVARPQRCPTCGKTFRYRSNLLEHQRVHLGEKVYRCDRCSKSFFYLSSILRHQRSHDAKCELRCGACLKLFKDPKYFSKHLQAHQGGRPFKCSTCGEAFSNTYGLKKHRHIHKMECFAAMGAHKEQP
ncbi:hypothetical protein Chor_014603, partial [Crotalus horridus]